MAIEIVDFPMKNCDFPQFFVSLPEGSWFMKLMFLPWTSSLVGDLSVALSGVLARLRPSSSIVLEAMETVAK